MFLDDALIYSKDNQSHMKEVFKTLYRNKLFAMLSKREFHKIELDFLVHQISGKELKIDPGKVNAALAWETRQTRWQLQNCLGFANSYCCFFSIFSQLVLPFKDLLGKKPKGLEEVKPDTQLNWSFQLAFEKVKALFTTEPLLSHPDENRKYVVQADSGDIAIGAVILQKGRVDTCIPVPICEENSSKQKEIGQFGAKSWLRCNWPSLCGVIGWKVPRFLSKFGLIIKIWCYGLPSDWGPSNNDGLSCFSCSNLLCITSQGKEVFTKCASMKANRRRWLTLYSHQHSWRRWCLEAEPKLYRLHPRERPARSKD